MFHICALLYLGNIYGGVWKIQYKSEDNVIQTLSKTLPLVIESGLVVTTNKKYFRWQKNCVDRSSTKQGAILSRRLILRRNKH